MFGLGTPEIILIIVVVLVLFGAKKIPELAKGISEGVKHLRHGFKDDLEENKDYTKKK